MINKGILLNDAAEIMYQNNCMLKLMQGYCFTESQNVDEMHNLLPSFEILISNTQKLWDIIDEFERDELKRTHPELYN